MENSLDMGQRIARRNDFQERMTRRLVVSNLISGACVAALVGDKIYSAHHPPDLPVILTDSEGNTIKVTPLNQPVMSQASLLDWVGKAAVAPYNWDYVHYRDTLSRDAAPYFTSEGWKRVTKSLEETGNVQQAVKAAMVASAIVTKPPVETEPSQKLGGVLTWKFEVPILATFANLRDTLRMDLLTSLQVIRVPLSFHPKGIAVDSYVTKPI